jgi:hypothetical protein
MRQQNSVGVEKVLSTGAFPVGWGMVCADSITNVRNSQNYYVCSGDKSKEDEAGGETGTHMKRNAYNFDGEARRKTTTRQNSLQMGRLHCNGSSTRWKAVDWIYIISTIATSGGLLRTRNELPDSLQRREFLALQSTLVRVSPPSSWWARDHLSSTAW